MSTPAKPRAPCRNGSACTFGAKCKFYHAPQDGFSAAVPGGPAPSHRRPQRIDLGPSGAVSVKSTYASAAAAAPRPASPAVNRAPFQEPPPRSPAVSPKPKAVAPLTEEEKEVAKVRSLLPIMTNRVARLNLLGEHLYPKIHQALKEGDEALKAHNLWTPAINAGKLTGMILEAYSVEECLEILGNSTRLAEEMANGCEVIYDHEKKRAAGGK